MGYRISPEEVEKPGINLEDSLYFVETIKTSVDYIHLSIGNYKRTSLNDSSDRESIINKFVKTVNHEVPLIGIGSVETSYEAEEVLENGAEFVALGRTLIREPQWVQKITAGNEKNMRRTINPLGMDLLHIPRAMQVFLLESFYDVMNFTTNKKKAEDYQNQFAPMEGYEKKIRK